MIILTVVDVKYRIMCPICGYKSTLYRSKTGVHWCRRCGAEWMVTPKKPIKKKRVKKGD